MEEIYMPYDVVVSEDNKLVAVFEEDDYLLQELEKEDTPFMVDVDVDFDEEEEEFYLLLSIYKGEVEIFIPFPYGESWDELLDSGELAIVVASKEVLEGQSDEEVKGYVIELDEETLGFIEGAKRVIEILENTEE